MTLPQVGLLAGPALDGLLGELRAELDGRVAFVEDGAQVEAWLVVVPGCDPERLQAVRDGDVPALFLVEAGEQRAWWRVLRKGVHDLAVLPFEAEELRARLLGLCTRRNVWNDVAGSFAREVAHDLRGPLQALQLTVAALQTEGAVPAAYQEDIDALLEAVDLADLLLDGVANMGRRPLPAPAESVDLLALVRKVAGRRAFHGRVTLHAGEALRVRVAPDVLQAVVEDVLRVAWVRAAGRRDVSVSCIALGGEAVLTAQAKAYAALLDHLPGLLSREKPILLRRQRVPMPLSGLGYARDVARAAGGDVDVRRADADLVVELRLPLAGGPGLG